MRKFRTRFDESLEISTVNNEPSLTDSWFADSCDIYTILEQSNLGLTVPTSRAMLNKVAAMTNVQNNVYDINNAEVQKIDRFIFETEKAVRRRKWNELTEEERAYFGDIETFYKTKVEEVQDLYKPPVMTLEEPIVEEKSE